MVHCISLSFCISLTLCCVLMSSCSSNTKSESSHENLSDNPVFAPWTGPYNGVPAFDKIEPKHFIPAVEAAIAEKRTEIDQIARQVEEPSFANTLEALEKSGNALKRVQSIYYVWTSNMSSPEMDSIQNILEPRFAAFQDSVIQNSALFARIEKLYQSKDSLNLNPEQQRLLWRYYTTFTLAGAKLDPAAKERVAAINQKLASLFAQFSQHLLADETKKYLEISDAKDLEGLSESYIQSAVEAATSHGKSGSWIIANTRSAIEPFLTNCNNRSLREKAWRMFINRGDNGDANDNNAIIPEILKLRAERAELMGYPTHAHLRLADKMAQTPERAMALLESVWPYALDRVKEEVDDMQAYANQQKENIKIEAWDYRYYMEKVRKQKYDLDEAEIKAYLQMDKIREGMFFVAGELFGLKFSPVSDVPVFHPDVTVYKVSKIENDALVGLWYFDPYARSGKRSGAWMTAYRDQEKLNGEITTIVSNNCNFLKAKAGDPVLISWDDAVTLFHEFGHALHGLCSKVVYPSLSGTNVATDYVEFPSQVLERWLSTPEVLQKYAIHYQTGKPMPQELLDKINKAATFNQGFSTLEYLASAMVDMKLHLAGKQDIDPDVFERETLTALKMPNEMVMRHRTPQFGHLFADDGYSAGYYSYLWSDVHSADAWEAFTEAGGAYDPAVAKRLNDFVFSAGATLVESEGYQKFRGRPADQKALMRERGFIR